MQAGGRESGEVRRADPAARRQAAVVVAVAIVVGVLLIAALERYRIPLRDWVLADPEKSAERLNAIIFVLAALLVAPLLGLAAYLWSLGGRILRARAFPPPGLRVVRDTQVVTGEAAISKGRQLKVMAVGCGIAGLALGVLLWRLMSLFGDGVA